MGGPVTSGQQEQQAARQRGWAFTRIDSSAGVASAVMQIPTVVDFPLDADPCKVIKTGDYVRLDGEKGTLEILERA